MKTSEESSPSPSPAGASCIPDDDDLLREILTRLPPDPSSLPRASAVCKRWLGLVTDPKFHRQFCAHHRKPPLLGVFSNGTSNIRPSSTDKREIVLHPVLDPPNRIRLPPVRFPLARFQSSIYVLDCRHGLVLVASFQIQVFVCDPITGEQHSVAIPPEFKLPYFRGAVLCAAGNQLGHVHGVCHSSPFKVVLVSMRKGKPFARVYSSETGGWGNIMSIAAPDQLGDDICGTSTLVGNTLYWLTWGDRILELDLDGQGLSLIMGPPVTHDSRHEIRQIVHAEDGALGFAILSYPHFQIWQMNVNGHGLTTWVPWKTIEMDSIVGLPQVEGDVGWEEKIKGYEEDTDVLFLEVNGSVYMVQLESMQSKKLDVTFIGRCRPFRSFYTQAIRGCSEADVLPDS